MSPISELLPDLEQSIRNAIEQSRSASDDPLYADLLISETSSTFQIPNFVAKFYAPNRNGQLEVEIGGELRSIKLSSDEDEIDFSIATWIFSTSDSRFDSITISSEGTVSQERVEFFTEKLAKACRNRRNQGQMKAVKLYVKLDIREDLLLNVLNSFDPKNLETIHLVSNIPNISAISNTEQWRSSKKLLIDKPNNIPISAFSHVQQFATMVDPLKSEEAWDCIQTFIKSNSPRESFFHIQSTTSLNVPGIVELTSGGKNEQVRISVDGFPSRFLHSLRFEMSSPDLVFVVLIADNEISGVTCHIDHVDEDCETLFSEVLAE